MGVQIPATKKGRPKNQPGITGVPPVTDTTGSSESDYSDKRPVEPPLFTDLRVKCTGISCVFNHLAGYRPVFY